MEPARHQIEFAPPRRLRVGPPTRRRVLIRVLEALDVAGMSCAFLAAAMLVPAGSAGLTIDEFLSMRLGIANFALFLGLLLAWHACFVLLRLYDSSGPVLAHQRLRLVLKATSIGTAVVWGIAVAFRITMVTPLFVLVLWALGSATVVGTRLALHAGLRLLTRGNGTRRNILIVGTGPSAIRFAAEIERSPEAGARVLGFVEPSEHGSGSPAQIGPHPVSDLDAFPVFLRDNVVDEIVIAVPASELQYLRTHLIGCCEESGVPIRFLSSILADLEQDTWKEQGFADEIVMTVYNGTTDGWPLLIKRAVDVVGALGLIIALSPLLGLIAVLIRISSPGPVLFRQERFGLNKRRFSVLKFRTMVADAEERIADIEHLNESGGPTFKLNDDPRVTPLGRILRSTSIDELPQLINVLKGEMSLVGPRPLPRRDVAGFSRDCHRRRFSVRPGITGLWQVSGRSSIPFERWMELDLQYIDEWSLTLDLTILARTIPAVWSRTGAS